MVNLTEQQTSICNAFQGKAEEAVKALNFDRTSIYRPGLLMCERQEQRTGEKIFRALAGACDKSEKYSISTEKVAKAMLVNSLRSGSGSYSCRIILPALCIL